MLAAYFAWPRAMLLVMALPAVPVLGPALGRLDDRLAESRPTA
jgi:hypothetical protein